MIPTAPFGRTGHQSSRLIFGAAALGGMSQERADKTLALITEWGLNHIDTAASYGESELRLAPWLRDHRKNVFLATKTGQRSATDARAELHRSLERLGVDSVDLIQMHNLVDEKEWDQAMGPGGALEALIDARDEGLVAHIGVTGHGTQVAAAHMRSLEKYPFASVLLPYNFTMMSQPEYAQDFDRLVRRCRADGVAVQTIKSIARRRWRDDDPEKRFSWYMPLHNEQALHRAVHYVLSRDDFFLNTSSDATLLETLLRAAAQPIEKPDQTQMTSDVSSEAMEPLFVRGVTDTI